MLINFALFISVKPWFVFIWGQCNESLKRDQHREKEDQLTQLTLSSLYLLLLMLQLIPKRHSPEIVDFLLVDHCSEWNLCHCLIIILYKTECFNQEMTDTFKSKLKGIASLFQGKNNIKSHCKFQELPDETYLQKAPNSS